jgi:hypothetical protein
MVGADLAGDWLSPSRVLSFPITASRVALNYFTPPLLGRRNRMGGKPILLGLRGGFGHVFVSGIQQYLPSKGRDSPEEKFGVRTIQRS